MKRSLLLALMLCGTALFPGHNMLAQRPNGNPWNYGGGNNNWDSSWNNRPAPGRGACFFTSAGFRGNKFCVRAGDRLPSLPGNFGDNISAIQVYGRSTVQIFNDRNFRNGTETVRGSVPDLRAYKFRGGHTWNNRISSIIVR